MQEHPGRHMLWSDRVRRFKMQCYFNSNFGMLKCILMEEM